MESIEEAKDSRWIITGRTKDLLKKAEAILNLNIANQERRCLVGFINIIYEALEEGRIEIIETEKPKRKRPKLKLVKGARG